MKSSYLVYSPEVKEAKQQGKPLVALESTIITHGMPYPQNIETAQLVEQTVRDQGAVPATIAIIAGKIHVGLTDTQLKQIGSFKETVKVSRRDLPLVLSRGLHGGTTVAATMIAASLAGIAVFATGGIGGVHRGAEQSFDVSADLMELAHTNVAVISAGIKSILDIGKTLEYLETLGVPVIGYQSTVFPAFYTSHSGFAAPFRLDTPEEIALLLKTKWELELSGGVLIGNPIPKGREADPERINTAINKALEAARKEKITGKEVTPFLLEKVAELSGGESLEANIQLIINNAKLAAKIAAAFSRI